MHQLDTIDLVLISLAIAAFGAHYLYLLYKKARDEDERRRLAREHPQVWSCTNVDSEENHP